VQHVLSPQLARDSGERIELIELGGRRQQEQENEVYGLAVHGIELDGALQSCQQRKRLLDLAQPHVGNGDAAPDPGGAELVALLDLVDHYVDGQVERRGSAAASSFKKPALSAARTSMATSADERKYLIFILRSRCDAKAEPRPVLNPIAP
jgi:hypothetical protein